MGPGAARVVGGELNRQAEIERPGGSRAVARRPGGLEQIAHGVGAAVASRRGDRQLDLSAAQVTRAGADSQELIEQEVIDSEKLSQIIEENSPSPMIVPGTDAEPKRTDAADAKKESDSASGAAGG